MSNASSNAKDASTSALAPRWPGAFGTVLLTAAVFVFGQVGGGVLALGLSLLTGGVSLRSVTLAGSGVLSQFVFAAVVYGAMTGLLWWVLRRRSLGLADVGLARRPQWRDVIWSVAAFVAYFSAYAVVLMVVTPFIPGLNTDQRQDVGFDGASGLSLVLVFAALAIIAPFAEELLMRGFLFTGLRRRLRFFWATLVTSVIFASLHLGGGEAGAGPLWIAAVDTFVLSCMLCYLREKTGQLWAGIGLHMIKNSVAFAMLFIFHAAS